jgi:hypothetical protein
MKLQVFSVFDKAVGAHLQPFFCRSKGDALRSFGDACNDEKHQFFQHGLDYVLVFLGEFDDVSGLFATQEPARLLSAVEVKVEDKDIPFAKADLPVKRRLPM